MRPHGTSTRQHRPDRQQRDGERADEGSQDQRAAERDVTSSQTGALG